MARGSRKYSQGPFKPTNPKKYVGSGTIFMRSSWEFTFASFCDHNDNILEWASEPIRIPYRHPLSGKNTTYVPDFLIRYKDKNNRMLTELIEIKPMSQSVLKEGMKPNQRATVAVNMAKWAAAKVWCQKNGISFRVVTEEELYRK